jgi:hypothetical protein
MAPRMALDLPETRTTTMTVSSEEDLELSGHMENVGSDAQPDWVTGELPAQYADVARQIAALRAQARQYEGVAGVLWQTGPALTDAVGDLFAAIGFDVEKLGSGSNYDLRVDLGADRQLLVVVVGGSHAIDRRSPQIAQILRALQADAGEKDRVVLAANLFAAMPVMSRPDEQVTVDALRLIQGLGANFVPTSTLFGLWKASLQDAPQARKSVFNLHAMDGGMFR